MSKSDSWETDLLNHLFTNTAVLLVGDAEGLLPSAAAGDLYVSLHSADPTEAGDQSSDEATFTGYARVPVLRSAAQWTVSGNSVKNTNAVTFTVCSGGSTTVTHFGIGTDASGTGKLLYSGAVTPSVAVTTGITAIIPALGAEITED